MTYAGPSKGLRNPLLDSRARTLANMQGGDQVKKLEAQVALAFLEQDELGQGERCRYVQCSIGPFSCESSPFCNSTKVVFFTVERRFMIASTEIPCEIKIQQMVIPYPQPKLVLSIKSTNPEVICLPSSS